MRPPAFSAARARMAETMERRKRGQSIGRAIGRTLEKSGKAEVKDALKSGELVEALVDAIDKAPSRNAATKGRKNRKWVSFRDRVLRPLGGAALRIGIRSATGGILG